MKKSLIAAAVSVALIAGASAANVANDNASTANYPGGAWATGSNGGVGFGAWALTTSSGGFAGSYIGGTALGNPSFGIYSGGNASAGFVAYRPFTGGSLAAGSMSVGSIHLVQVCSVDVHYMWAS